MTAMTSPDAQLAAIERLRSAMNNHDLEALVACFSDDCVSEHPCHPDRSFTGADQVRRNWMQILVGVPDLRATLVSSHADVDRVWCEWEWSGTRRDGAPHLMRGTTITTVDQQGLIANTRFYMEPVSRDGVGVDAQIRQVMQGGAAGPAR